MDSQQPKMMSAPVLEKEPTRKAIPTPDSVYGVFDYYTVKGTEHIPDYTFDQLRDLLPSTDFTKRVAKTRSLAASFDSTPDIRDEGTANPPELTPAKLNAVIASFIDESSEAQDAEHTDGLQHRFQLERQFAERTALPKIVKLLENQNFRPAFPGGNYNEPRIEIVAKIILDAIKEEITFPDMRTKAKIFTMMTRESIPEVVHFALKDPSINVEQDTKTIFNRLFSGSTLREESLKRFLYDVTLSPEEMESIFNSLDFLDYNLTSIKNMVKGYESKPELKEETIAHTSNLVTTLTNAYSKTLNEKFSK